MQRCLEGACEEGERTIKKLKTSRSSLPLLHPQESSETIDSSPSSFCIFTKLLDLYQEESAKDIITDRKPGLRRNTRVLEKLVARERLNTLILNLHPGNKGYSLAFRTHSRTTNQNMDDTANMIETKQWPYEEKELLSYIDNEELPPHLTDLLETHYSFLYYNGCIIVEVRDYRQSYPHSKCDIHHVLLRPTLKSLLADINNIAEEKVDWGAEEKQQLESQILLANNPTLCLDPNNSVSSAQSRINYNRQMWNTHTFRRAARKFSQVTVNRKRKLDQFTHRPGLELFDFVARFKAKPKTDEQSVNKVSKKSTTDQPKLGVCDELKPIPVPNLDPIPLSPPTQGVFINEFKTYQRPKETSDCLPQLIEEYVLETDMPSKEKGKQRVYHIKLSILQRPSNSEYLGELYLDRDHKKNERNGVACRFSLGSRANANRYIHQFTDIFTESGRKSVRIRYGLSPGYKERVAIAQAQAQIQAQNAAQVNLPQQHLTQLSQTLQTQTCVNGAVGSRISLVQQNQSIQNTSNVPILQSHLQGTAQMKTASQVSNQELEINAITNELMNSAQQFQAAASAKQQQQQQQQQQKLSSNRNNTAIINLLTSSPASNINSDAVVNAINNSSLLPQVPTINQKLLARKMTLSNVANARVLNHSNLIAVNNNRLNISEQQGQTITLTSVNSGGSYSNYTTVPLKPQQLVNSHQQIITNNTSDSSKSALSALLVGTPAADRPDIVGPNTNSLLLEKLAGSAATATSSGSASSSSSGGGQNSTHFIQSIKSAGGLQYVVQSPPKTSTTVVSPLSSPPPQAANTINFAQLQSISGLQNVQVQLPGFAQPISLSLNVSSTGNIQGHPTSLLVSLPVTTSTTTNTITQSAGGVGAPTVVLANAGTSNIAQLVTSGVKGLAQQGLRATGPMSLTQGGQSYQLVTPIQRPRMQQAIQRTPITLKMATQNSNAAQVTLPSNASITSQLQKQAQFQQYQQLCLNQQQKNVAAGVAGKLRRRSNTSEQQ